MLVQMNHADRVDRVGLETAVDGHHPRAGGQNIVGHAFQQCLRQLLMHRTFGHVQHHQRKAGRSRTFQFQRIIGRQHHSLAGGRFAKLLPVGGTFEQDHQRIGSHDLGQLGSQVDDALKLLVEFDHRLKVTHRGTPDGRVEEATSSIVPHRTDFIQMGQEQCRPANSVVVQSIRVTAHRHRQPDGRLARAMDDD